MIARLAPLLLVVAGTLTYHIAAKSIPSAFDPLAAIVGLYATALAAIVLLYGAQRPSLSSFAWTRIWHPTIAGVGIGALMIEAGFLLAYRGGWAISVASVITNGLAAVLLLGVGAAMFHEPITPTKAVGLVLCLAGIALLQR
jgi:multidrug transporter EmrE-like cation transporter